MQESNSRAKAILTDVTRCIGCERCVEGCTRQNHLPKDIPARYKANDGLSGRRFTSINRTAGREKGTWRSVRRQCMHCLEPACAAACLVSAFTKTPDGAVVYDDDKCIGCRYCMLACPFMIPRYEYDALHPFVRKCRMNDACRVEGGLPACCDACPTGATIFGPRDKLLAEAHKRIEAAPDRYVNHVWGETEFGGTSVIYIGDINLSEILRMPSRSDLERLRVPELTDTSIPELLHNWVMVTPVQFLAVSAGLAATWVIRRRQELQDKGESGDDHG
jgi:formate dehydrogenase iron-sulfur subunit